MWFRDNTITIVVAVVAAAALLFVIYESLKPKHVKVRVPVSVLGKASNTSSEGVKSGDIITLTPLFITLRDRNQGGFCSAANDGKIKCGGRSVNLEDSRWIIEKVASTSGTDIMSSDTILLRNKGTGYYLMDDSGRCTRYRMDATNFNIYAVDDRANHRDSEYQVLYNNYSNDKPGILLTKSGSKNYCRYNESGENIICDANSDKNAAMFFVNRG